MKRLEDLPWWTVPAALLGIPGLLAIGSMLAPRTFYDNLVWKYYWGPIKADAFRAPLEHNGITAYPGYNLVNTASWVVLMGLCILGLYQMMRHYNVRFDARLIYGAVAWVVAGSVFHVLQDTTLFLKPLEYLFITPPIYLLFALGGVASLLLGIYLRKTEEAAGREVAYQKLWLVFSGGGLIYLVLWLEGWEMITQYVNPLWVIGFGALTFFIMRARFDKTGQIDPTETVFWMSLPFTLLSIAYVLKFLDEPWHRVGTNQQPWTFILAPALAALTAAAVYYVAKWRRGDRSAEDAPVWVALMVPVNLLLIFSQMVDAYATSIGLDIAGYTEKHVLSGLVIDSFKDFSQNVGFAFGAAYPTFLAFAPLKLLVSLAVVYAIDVQSKEDAQQRPDLINIIKFAIIMVGIGPGIRNFVRLSLGV